MLSPKPNFSPFPFERVRRLTGRQAAFESAIARWIVARPLAVQTAKLVGGPMRARLVGAYPGPFDPHAAVAEVRTGGLSILLAASARAVRRLAQRLLGGPAELEAPRPLTTAEHAIWALAIAAAIEDLGSTAEVWPLAGSPMDTVASWEASGGLLPLELAIEPLGSGTLGAMTVVAWCPRELEVRTPPERPIPGWRFALPLVLARCPLSREAAHKLAPRDVVVVDRLYPSVPDAWGIGLVIGDGMLGVSALPDAVEATVTTGYVRHDMALPDDAHLELTVQLGTTHLSLRQIANLAVGQIISLGRPLAGPYDIRVGNRLLGQGELVDVDGELGVRIVSLIEE
ncbi:MAG: type secretion system protein [Deltaproteobacteria bacterium]|nr:type secretion system protein [Deltaproteobacteria bacterium]